MTPLSATRRLRPFSRRIPRVAIIAVTFWCLLIVAWQVIANQVGPLLLPGLDSIVGSGLPEVIREGYYINFLNTLRQLGLGFLIACVVAIPLGAIMGRSRWFRDMLTPYAYGLYVTPKEALLPLLIIIFGTSLGFQVVVVVLFSFFFPLINTAAGVSRVDGPLLDASRALCTPKARLLMNVLLPASLPYVVAGVRLGLGMAFNAMIVGELWVVGGTGGVLTTLSNHQELVPYFALVGYVSVAAVGSYECLSWLERAIRRRQGLAQEGLA